MVDEGGIGAALGSSGGGLDSIAIFHVLQSSLLAESCRSRFGTLFLSEAWEESMRVPWDATDEAFFLREF